MPQNIKSDEKEVTPLDTTKDLEVTEIEELDQSDQDKVQILLKLRRYM